ncbi:DUF937 domain-containing protein [Stappia sp. ES.058]|uniref:DUF937 domain-containing protein n=1 Tax=Stappia sp. ES.058 TaxID=1881061 RepID=UPI00087DD4EF|nr:DUF937 domain-containing protein [Stappia sp. ES.058]SDT90445.1 hypothetical protein SAMN05428979_0254 [Stappia sp. ES.058]
MSDSFNPFAAFDPASLSRDMQSRFGWGDADTLRAAEALMPAALAGMRHFGSSPSGFEALMALLPGPGRASGLPRPESLVGEPLALFFGPAETQAALADFIAEQTGLDRPGVETLMPVVATLALGQVARRFTAGPARDLLDAFLSGYARGRPKPIPNPMRMMEPYTEAMRSFWDGYMGLFDRATQAHETPADSADSGAVPEVPPETVPDTEPEAEDTPGETFALVDNWMALGRDLQDSQIRGFERFFERGPRGGSDT